MQGNFGSAIIGSGTGLCYAMQEDIGFTRKEDMTVKNVNKVYAAVGMVLPWITLSLLIGVSTYYCELLWLRIVCVLVAILNGGVMHRLAREVKSQNCVIFHQNNGSVSQNRDI